MSQPLVFKPLFLDRDGIFAQAPDGSIINIGGTIGPYFSVGGKALLFDDGTSSGPSGGTITLQTVYDHSFDGNGNARIKLTTGKDLIIADDTNDNIFFKIDSETGKVTITGDLEIAGSSTVINTNIQDSDHWIISPSSGSVSALKIEPDVGVTPIVDLITVRKTFGSPAVFRVDKDGNTLLTNLTVSGLINGVDVAQLKATVDAHLDGTGVHHQASAIDITPISGIVGTTVQAALEELRAKVAVGGDDPTAPYGQGDCRGFEHIQSASTKTWMISHGRNTRRVTVALYDDDWQQMIPDTIKIMDANTVAVMFGSAVTGRAMLTLF